MNNNNPFTLWCPVTAADQPRARGGAPARTPGGHRAGLIIATLIKLCRDHSLARHHFRWDGQLCTVLSANLRWLLAAALGLASPQTRLASPTLTLRPCSATRRLLVLPLSHRAVRAIEPGPE